MLDPGKASCERSARRRAATRVAFGQTRAPIVLVHAVVLCSSLGLESARAANVPDGEGDAQHASSEVHVPAPLEDAHSADTSSKRHRSLFFGGVAALFLIIAGAVATNDRRKRQPR